MANEFGSENNIIKHVAKEIVRECTDTGIHVPQELAEYVVRMKLLNPKNGYTAERVMPRDLTQKLISSCVQDFAKNTPATDAIRLQIFWKGNPLDSAKQKYEAVVKKNSETILKEILESKYQLQEKDKILRKMASFIVAYSGVGNLNLVHVLRETRVVLQSVFKARDIQQFLESETSEKIEKLEIITRVVVGIRLFHKHCGIAKDGIDDLPVILSQGLESIKKRIEDSLLSSEKKINSITNGLKALYLALEYNQGPFPDHVNRKNLEICKDVLIIMLQYEVYFRNLLANLEEAEKEIEEIEDECRITLLEIEGKVKNRLAIPTSNIYPLFTKLGNLWVQLQIKTHFLIQLNSVITNLNSINKYFEVTPFEETIDDLARTEPEKPVLGENRIKETEEMHPDIAILTDDKQPQIQIQFEGFCAWSLSQMEGFLLPGNFDIGLLQYRDLTYAFSSVEAAKEWSKNPDLHIKKALNAGRSKPALVEFLGLYQQLNEVKHLPLIEEEKEGKVIKDAMIQTEVHPVKEFLDKDYAFSEWELKRRAIELSRIMKCWTKSQQAVNHSTCRAFIGTQTAPAKDGSCQTVKDDFCVTPTPSRFIVGLRGLRGDQVRDFTLTLPFRGMFDPPQCNALK